MRYRTSYRDHGGVTRSATADARLYRRPDLGWVGGVASGIAVHTGLRWRTVAGIFVLLSIAGGLGIALYVSYWIVLPVPEGVRSRLPRAVEIVVRTVAVLAAITAVVIVLVSGGVGGLFVPTLLACIGGAFIWRQATEQDRSRWRRAGQRSLADGRAGQLRLAVGAVLVIAGGALVLHRADFTAARDGLLALFVAVVGLAVLTGPWWIGLVTQLSDERRERIRSQERADIAAHLHDSVLQTLALIQRNADSPREVARLARGQERELRGLLYGTRAASGQLADGLRAAAAEVEDAYAITIDVVVVGDVALNDGLAAACAAAREAMVNAAKHADVTEVTVYAEVEPEQVSVFVRDRGRGFDADDVADDRQGIRNSILGRVERYGGTATVLSAAGAGTDVHITMPPAPKDHQ